MTSLFHYSLSSFHTGIPQSRPPAGLFSVSASLFNFIHFLFAHINSAVHYINNYKFFLFFVSATTKILYAAQCHLQCSTMFFCVSSTSVPRCCGYFGTSATIFGSPQSATTETSSPQTTTTPSWGS